MTPTVVRQTLSAISVEVKVIWQDSAVAIAVHVVEEVIEDTFGQFELLDESIPRTKSL